MAGLNGRMAYVLDHYHTTWYTYSQPSSLIECVICLQTGNICRCVWVALKISVNVREREHLTLKLCYPLLIDTAFQVCNTMKGNFMLVSSNILLIGKIPQNLINAFS